jgi:hypothetical protein
MAAITAYVWGDGPTLDLDRFESTPESDMPSWGLAGERYDAWCEWWSAAREPWGCYIELPDDEESSRDLQLTCDNCPQVAGVVYSDQSEGERIGLGE